MQSTHIYWASTLFQTLVSNRGLRDEVHTDPAPWHSQPGRAAGHMSRHSQYSVVSVLEVAQVTEGAQRRDPGPAVGSKEGFLGDVSLEDFRECARVRVSLLRVWPVQKFRGETMVAVVVAVEAGSQAEPTRKG